MLIWRKEWGVERFREYLQKSKFTDEIFIDVKEQWTKGNRGNKGDWK